MLRKTGKTVRTLALAFILSTVVALGFASQTALALSEGESVAAFDVASAADTNAVSSVATPEAYFEDQAEDPTDEVVIPYGSYRAITDSEVPLSTQQYIQNWSLLDLTLTVLSVILALVLIVGGLITHVGDEYPKRMPLRALSIVPAIGTIVLFYTTQNLSLPMSLVDDMTIWFTLLTVISVVLALLATRKSRLVKSTDAQKPLKKPEN